MKKRHYISPAVNKVIIDYTISAQMYSPPPPPPPDDRGIPKNRGVDSPFKSPFGDKPFG